MTGTREGMVVRDKPFYKTVRSSALMQVFRG